MLIYKSFCSYRLKIEMATGHCLFGFDCKQLNGKYTCLCSEAVCNCGSSVKLNLFVLPGLNSADNFRFTGIDI